MADIAQLMEANRLMEEYYDRFGDVYPTFVFPEDSLDDTVRKLRDCLERGEPLEYDDSDEILY